MLIRSAGASPCPTVLDIKFTFTDNCIFIIFSDIPHFVRRDIFTFAKVILRLRRSDILFANNTRKANITRLKAVYHCVAIELAVRRIELKKALAIASAFFGGSGWTRASLGVRLLRKPPIYRPVVLIHPFLHKNNQPQKRLVIFGGSGWIRTTEVVDNRFTVCPLWPLGNTPT